MAYANVDFQENLGFYSKEQAIELKQWISEVLNKTLHHSDFDFFEYLKATLVPLPFDLNSYNFDLRSDQQLALVKPLNKLMNDNIDLRHQLHVGNRKFDSISEDWSMGLAMKGDFPRDSKVMMLTLLISQSYYKSISMKYIRFLSLCVCVCVSNANKAGVNRCKR